MNNLLLNWYESVCIAIIVIIGLFIFVSIIGYIFFGVFSHILKKHNDALALVLKAKYDNIEKLLTILIDNDVSDVDKYLNKLHEIQFIDMQRQDSKQCQIVRETLSSLRDEAMFLLESNPSVNKNEIVKTAKKNILDIDIIYRNHIAMYNADVLGYNYWIKFLPNRLIFKMFKVREKELIS